MLEALQKRWWLVLIRGIAAIAFGVLALIWPGITLLSLVLLYGAYALIDGLTGLGVAVFGADGLTGGDRWWLALIGLFGVAAGIVTFVWPGITGLVLAYVIGFWAIVTGLTEIFAAIRLRKEIDNEWWLGLSGLLVLILGLIIVFRPLTGALALITWIAFFSIAWGIALVILSFRVRSMPVATPQAA